MSLDEINSDIFGERLLEIRHELEKLNERNQRIEEKLDSLLDNKLGELLYRDYEYINSKPSLNLELIDSPPSNETVSSKDRRENFLLMAIAATLVILLLVLFLKIFKLI